MFSPAPPPIKKQRATNTPQGQNGGISMEETISDRRAKLRNMMERSVGGTIIDSTTSDLLAMARTHLDRSHEPFSVKSHIDEPISRSVSAGRMRLPPPPKSAPPGLSILSTKERHRQETRAEHSATKVDVAYLHSSVNSRMREQQQPRQQQRAFSSRLQVQQQGGGGGGGGGGGAYYQPKQQQVPMQQASHHTGDQRVSHPPPSSPGLRSVRSENELLSTPPRPSRAGMEPMTTNSYKSAASTPSPYAPAPPPRPSSAGSSNGVHTPQPPPPTRSNIRKSEDGVSSLGSHDPDASFSSAKSANSNRTNMLRLVQKLVEVTEEKTAALDKITELEKDLFDLQNKQRQTMTPPPPTNNNKIDAVPTAALNGIRPGATIMMLIMLEQKMKQNRIRQAFQIWKNQNEKNHEHTTSPDTAQRTMHVDTTPGSGSIPTLSFLNSPTPSSHRRSTMTPKPTGRGASLPSNILSTKYLIEALSTVSLEYTSDFAVYTIRRPYLPSSENTANADGIADPDSYHKNANILNPSTIEVTCKIYADESSLILFSESSVQHTSPNMGKRSWEDANFGLGNVLYIDSHGLEQEYLLDDIYEEAIITRNSYCSSLRTAAQALQAASASISSDASSVTSTTPSYIHPPQPKDRDISTLSPVTETRDAFAQTDLEETPPLSKTDAAPPIAEPFFGKPNSTLDAMFSSFFFTTFRGVFFFLSLVFYRLPRIFMKTAFYFTFGGVVLTALWMYFADDRGALSMGAFSEDVVRPYPEFWSLCRKDS